LGSNPNLGENLFLFLWDARKPKVSCAQEAEGFSGKKEKNVDEKEKEKSGRGGLIRGRTVGSHTYVRIPPGPHKNPFFLPKKESVFIPKERREDNAFCEAESPTLTRCG
jgi:hypothetical protein